MTGFLALAAVLPRVLSPAYRRVVGSSLMLGVRRGVCSGTGVDQPGLACRRLLRCHPFARAGNFPVPAAPRRRPKIGDRSMDKKGHWCCLCGAILALWMVLFRRRSPRLPPGRRPRPLPLALSAWRPSAGRGPGGECKRGRK